MDDDEYYIEDDEYMVDGDYDDMDGELTWEQEVENNYYTAKSNMDDNPAAAIEGFQGVLSGDQDNGKWVFKAYKALVKTTIRSKQFDQALEYYKKLLAADFQGKNRHAMEKAVNKITDWSQHASGPVFLRELHKATIDFVCKDLKQYEKLWFNTKLKLAQLNFDEGARDGLETEIVELKQWCMQPEGTSYDEKKGTQLLSLLALEIQLQTELANQGLLRDLYFEAIDIKSAIPPPRILGIIRECGGKMHMRAREFDKANEAFFLAFKAYDEAGHPKRIQCLKYLVLAVMLSGSKINPFDSPEPRSYKNHPEIVAISELIDACTRVDIKLFQKVLKDHHNTLTGDQFLYSYISPLMDKIRKEVILKLSKPYTSLRLDYLAKELQLSVTDVEAMTVTLIIDGRLMGSIDQRTGILYLEAKGAGEGDKRDEALSRWYERQEAVLSTVMAKSS